MLIAVIGVLRAYDQKPPPSFPYGLTLNTIVSIIQQHPKLALLFLIVELIGQLKWVWLRQGKKPLKHVQSFDDASRGPLGSLTILFGHKGLSLVSLRATMTTLALPFDPFI